MSHGNIILLNGLSSSGKTSIANALQDMMVDYYFHTGIDHYLERVPSRFNVASDGKDPASADGILWVMNQEGRIRELRYGPVAFELVGGMYEAIAALSRAGVDVIVDDVIFEARILKMAVDSLHSLNPLFVAVECPLELAEQREASRGSRQLGLARAQHHLVHAHGIYDLEVDTSKSNPAECAGLIRDRVLNGPPPDAMRRLHYKLFAE